MNDAIDRKNAAFYLTLIGLIVLDVILLFWIFTPFGNVGANTTSVVYAADRPSVAVEKPGSAGDHVKPSSFDYFAKRSGRSH